MKTILLPTDFSENSWNAIVYALNFLEKEPCTFYLLHVTRLGDVMTNELPYTNAPEVIENTYTKPAKKKLREFLKRIATQFPDNLNHSFYTLTDYNFFIESIRKHVEEKKVNLIVMGTKGASGLKKYIVGTNTGDIITKVHCTTLVVPENATFTTLEEIAFPTDFLQFYGVKTLLPLLDILEHNTSALKILHISKKEVLLNSEQQKNKEFLADYFNNHQHSFHFLTNNKVEKAVQCFVESRSIKMIAMVAKNLNYFQQILFHSKVEEISYQTDIPFLVLHE